MTKVEWIEMKLTRRQKDLSMFKFNLANSPKRDWLMSLYHGTEQDKAIFWNQVQRLGIKR